MGEFDYISWLRSRTPADPRVLVGPGDDTAVLAPVGGQLLITTDMLMDGTDFVLSEVGPLRAGRKAMAVNLSDIAAMAGVPVAAVVSVALPQGPNLRPLSGEEIAQQLYVGLRGIADEFRTPIVGGDTNSWSGGLVISVTVLGKATGPGPVLRSGARPGDWIFVTGPLGGSILGRHMDFLPRLQEAQALHQTVDLHAMIDISDGLAADLNHILEESRCGAVLTAESIPLAMAAHQLANSSGKTPLQHALDDGEDFELVFVVSPGDGERLLRDQPVEGITLTKIGECVAAGLWIREKGEQRPLEPTGWSHPID